MWTRRALVRTGLAGAGLAGMAAGAWGFGYEPVFPLHLARYWPQPPGWPAGLRLRIAALADLHAGAPLMTLDRVAEIVAAANALQPDMVVLLGDYGPVSRLVPRPYPPEAVAEALSGLSARWGRFAIAGNHDWWEDAAAMAREAGRPAMLRALERTGFTVLQNEALRHPAGFWIAGLDSQIAFLPKRGWPRVGADDLPGTLAQARDEAPLIMLAHEPDIFAEAPARATLTLCGHTHGGQVRVLGYSPRVPSRYGNRYAYGHVREGGRDLIVSGGLGTSNIPVRFGVPPEITLVELG
jgi:predicted MPP superfamily phosphohydrolase